MLSTYFFAKNRKRLYELLGQNFSVQLKGGTTDFLYLTGIDREDVAFSAECRDGIVKETFFIPAYDPIHERWYGRMLRKEDVPFENVVEGEVPEFDGTCPEIAKLRAVKAEEEIDAIRRAILLTALGINRILEFTHPGKDVYEYHLRAEFEKVLADNACHTPAFDTIIGAGENSLCLHYPQLDCPIRDGDSILIDLGATVDHLCADISRVLPASGSYSDRQRALTNLACDAVDYVCASAKPFDDNKKLNELQDEYLKPRLEALGLSGTVKDYVWHNISHHLGFDCHDAPPREIPIPPGAVFTLEVGIYVPEWRFGVRIEDDILMNSDGCENLSAFIPRRAEEIEEAMALLKAGNIIKEREESNA